MVFERKTLPGLAGAPPEAPEAEHQRGFRRFACESSCSYIGGWAVLGLQRSPTTAGTAPLDLRAVLSLMRDGKADGTSRLCLDESLRAAMPIGQLVTIKPAVGSFLKQVK